jgi:hypothetical protein
MLEAVAVLVLLEQRVAMTHWALVALEPHHLLQDRQLQGLVVAVEEVLMMGQLLALRAVRAVVEMVLKT